MLCDAKITNDLDTYLTKFDYESLFLHGYQRYWWFYCQIMQFDANNTFSVQRFSEHPQIYIGH